ncbi:hypothetical protein M2282_006037 [Variovorax boronicumulans]|nr:hypothetical protein [Variovorax boronicumulans]
MNAEQTRLFEETLAEAGASFQAQLRKSGTGHNSARGGWTRESRSAAGAGWALWPAGSSRVTALNVIFPFRLPKGL